MGSVVFASARVESGPLAVRLHALNSSAWIWLNRRLIRGLPKLSRLLVLSSCRSVKMVEKRISKKQSATQPLQGKRVLLTRTPRQAAVLCEQLRELGAIPVEFPTIRIVPPQDWGQLDAALRRLYATDGTKYDWLVFTSSNGVNICMERLRSLGYDPQALSGVRVATIGPKTAAALAHYGITVDLVPDEYIAERVAEALIKDMQQSGVPMSEQRVLLARAAEARQVLVTELQRAGAQVDEVAGYYTVPATNNDVQGREVLHLLQNHQLDILTFTSSSTVKNFVAWLKS